LYDVNEDANDTDNDAKETDGDPWIWNSCCHHAAVGFTFYRWLVRVPGSQIPSRHTYAL
jgi:hypothetical protein